MALGGGTFMTQNKVLPGAYINFAVSYTHLEAESKKKKNRRIREGRSATDRFFVCGGRKKTDIAEEKGASPTAFDRICKEEMVSL